jgi:polyvinyl alcohol dehydrogenase (cytochrome)
MAMSFRNSCLLAACLWVGVQATPLMAQEDGAYLFKTYCAICHEAENGEEERAPNRDVLKQMTPEHILQVLETGAMKTVAAERSRAQRRILAEYLSEKKFGNAGPDLIPRSAFCTNSAASTGNLSGDLQWNGWGVSITNTRFQTAAAAGLTTADVPRLKLKWAFGYPGATSGGTQPVVIGGRLYVATAEGDVFALDAKTGCIHWQYQTEAGVRTALTISMTDGKLVAYLGDQSANMYALDAQSGKLIWKIKIDDHSRAAITAAPALYAGRLYVPVSSREESQVDDLKYACCTFRGSMVSLDAASGKVLWKTYMISEKADIIGKNSAGTPMWGPSGVPIWNSPAIDIKRRLLYSGTGNNYSVPATESSDAVVAFEMDTGKIRWINQVTANDVWNRSCGQPKIRNTFTCPDTNAPDADFASSPILADLKDGRQFIIAANKSSVYALDPDHDGKTVWQKQIAKSRAAGIMWGAAVDGENIYAANQSFDAKDPAGSGGISALTISSGDTVWSVPPPPCEDRKPCRPSHSAAVTAIPGVVFSGTFDGRLAAFSTSDGRTLWEYDTSKEFQTVNGVKANGGSMSNAGPTVVGGMVFVNSGYSHHGGVTPGNVLLGFGIE